MSQVLNTFLEWFNRLTPSEQAEIAHFIGTPTRQDGSYAEEAPEEIHGCDVGPASRPQPQYCPYCREPLYCPYCREAL